MSIDRVNFDPIADGGDNVTGALVKLDSNCQELSDAIGDASGGVGTLSERVDSIEVVVDGLGNSSTRNVGTATGTVAAGDDARFSGRNLLINADGRVNERSFAGGSIATNAYSIDRWRTFGSTASLSFASDRSTATLNGTIGQIIESPDLKNATVTVSVSNPTGPITVKIQPDATTSTTATGAIPAGSGIQSVTLAIPATLTGNAFMILSTSSSVTFDWSGKRSGIQVETGSVPTAFERRLVADEIYRCQRYFERVQGPTLMAAAFSSADIFLGVSFKATKRVAPTIIVASAGTYVGNNTTGTLVTAVTSLITVSGFSIDYTSFTGSVTAGLGYGIRGYDYRADSDF